MATSFDIPQAFSDRAKCLSIAEIGKYNKAIHDFLDPKLDPTDGALVQLKELYLQLNLPENEFMDAALFSIESTRMNPITDVRQVVAADSLKPYDYLIIEEKDGRKTELIYLGGRLRFFVLSSDSRSILSKDIIEVNTMPMTLGDCEEFSIIRSGEKFIPHQYKSYSTSYITKPLVNVCVYSSPEVYDCIDAESSIGDVEFLQNISDYEGNFNEFICQLAIKFEDINLDVYDASEHFTFPDYGEFLKIAKGHGVKSYILNQVLKAFEKEKTDSYEFVESDWKVVKSPEQIKEEEERADRENKAALKNYKKNFDEKLKEIRTRRVFVIFKAPGRLLPETEKYLRNIEIELERLADKGYGDKGWASMRMAAAKQQSNPPKNYNLKAVLWLVGVVGIIALGMSLFFKTKSAIAAFDAKFEDATAVMNEYRFDEAKEAFNNAYEEFSPRITRFLVKGLLDSKIYELEDAIDLYVEEGIQNLDTMLRADRGRFTDFTLEYLQSLLKLRPEDETLNQYYDKYRNQF